MKKSNANFRRFILCFLVMGVCLVSIPKDLLAQSEVSLTITRLVILANGHVVIDFELKLPAPMSNGRIAVFRNIPGTTFFGEVWRSDKDLPQVFRSSFTHNGADANQRSEAYFVVAYNSNGSTIATSTAHRTIFLRTPRPELCAYSLTLEWENYQVSTSAGVPVLLPVPFTSVEAEISTDGQQFSSIAMFAHPQPGAPPQQTRTTTLQSGRYFLRIKATEPASGAYAFSNVQIVDFNPPQMHSLQIDFVDVVQNREINIGFSGLGDIEHFNYQLWRAAGNDKPFTYVATVNTPGVVVDRPDLRQGTWIYRISAHHKSVLCPNAAFSATPKSSIFLKIEPSTGLHQVEAQWEHILPFNVSYTYTLFMQESGGQWRKIAHFSDPATRSYRFTIPRNVLGNELLLKIEASGSMPIQRIVSSNVAVIEAKSDVFVPNAFRPSSQTLENRVFKPIFVGFVPQEFLMVIFDRHGHQIFTSNSPDQGWDGSGSAQGGVIHGIYSYFIRFTNAIGNIEQRKGVVALVE
ncbi:MAG TPA: hypothetical protein DCM62_09665 [Bacteroidales bacterium]|nr:hypothetical protein [Bacteroidales bacterium]